MLKLALLWNTFCQMSQLSCGTLLILVSKMLIYDKLPHRQSSIDGGAACRKCVLCGRKICSWYNLPIPNMTRLAGKRFEMYDYVMVVPAIILYGEIPFRTKTSLNIIKGSVFLCWDSHLFAKRILPTMALITLHAMNDVSTKNMEWNLAS